MKYYLLQFIHKLKVLVQTVEGHWFRPTVKSTLQNHKNKLLNFRE